MKNILHELQRGHIPGWDSRMNTNTVAAKELNEKIKREREYLRFIMSPEDFRRLEKLESLHRERHSILYKNTYSNAFKLGVMLMCAVFMGED
jgi:hypothetical protein